MSTPRARLLIIDDEKALMKALCDTLGAEGYHTVGYSSARDALALLRNESFDVILTDLMMPEMDGVSVLDAAFQLDPHLVGIVMTGHASVDSAVNALQTGAVDYLLKPFKVNTVLPVLARALAVRRLRMENIQLREAVGLQELSLAIASARDADTLLEKVADAAFEQSDARAMHLQLADEGGQLRLAATRGETACGAEVIEGLPNGLSLPMISGGTFVGVLHFAPRLDGRTFTPGQRKALNILASTSASALAAANGVERLRTAEERYRRLSEDAPDVVARMELHPQSACTYVNPAVLTVTGYAPEDYYADAALALQIIHPDDRRLAQRALAGELENGSAITLRWVTRDGGIVWVEQRIALVRDRTGQVVAVETVSRDITQRRNLEEQLRHSQKLEAIGKLTAGVAHDFNNLLTIINGYAALALQEALPGSRTFQKLDQIRKAGDQAAGLTNQLLAFSRKQVMQPRTLNLGFLLDELQPLIQRLTGSAIEVSVSAEAGLGDVKIDPTQAQQVILNLAVNARDAMPDGGTLRFELANSTAQDVGSHVPGLRPGAYVSLTVADNGCGMTPETRQRIFEPFFTTKDLGRGTGLGLATVHGIVEQSSGHIFLASEAGVGTTFTILLPRSLEVAEHKAELQQCCPTGHETVLLLDDDAGVRQFTQDVLTGCGYNVLTASNGAQALRLVAEHGAAIQLLLSDMQIPGMSGAAVAEEVHRLLPRAKILLMSGYTEDAPPLLERLGAEFLAKPFTPGQLAQKARLMLNPNHTDAPNGSTATPRPGHAWSPAPVHDS